MKVGIIGAGYSGLYAIQQFRTNPDFEITVLEQQLEVGGLWCYTKNVGPDQFGLPIPASMYDNLRTHVPKQVMEFPDFKMEESKDSPTFVHHAEIKKYLDDFADHFDLKKYIKFGRAVKEIKRLESEQGETSWQVTCTNVSSGVPPGETEVFKFDKLMLCTGNHAIIQKPDVPGIETFPGIIMHSHSYRNNSTFNGKTVVVAGAGLSGVDIAQELGDVADQVILVNPRKIQFANCQNPRPIVEKQGYVEKIDGENVIISNGETVRADVVMFCTGYHMPDHLFHENCDITYNQRRLMPFYKFLVHIKYPSLAAISVLSKSIPTMAATVQVKFLKKLWAGEFSLPSEEEMLADAEAEFQRRLAMGFAPHYAHFMFGELQFNYINELNQVASLEPAIAPVKKKMIKYALEYALQNPEHYRDTGVTVLNDEEYELYPENEKVLDLFRNK